MGYRHCQILITGGGTAGLAVASRLIKSRPGADIVLLDPARKHYYQPAWVFAGAGIIEKEASVRDLKSLIPDKVHFLQEAAAALHPGENYIVTDQGKKISYDYLVLAPGIIPDWSGIKGLRESIGRDGVVSVYSYEHLDETWRSIRDFQGGNAVFTLPGSPVKCPSAPQKVMYLAEEYFTKKGVREDSDLIFFSAKDNICEVKKYIAALNKVIDRKRIKVFYKHKLLEIDALAKEATFECLETGSKKTVAYSMLHVTPPFKLPPFIKESGLANKNGFVDVDHYTLQHKVYKNVFALGDAADLPTSKTGAAARKQAQVVTENLLRRLKDRSMDCRYNGYTSCPIITGYGKVVLMEFDYEKNPCETFPFNQARERYSMYLLDKNVLPHLYWNYILTGKM
ncbi:FAD/NAD(P)-binding oxidoreductase [Pelotomaculum propionicicum]|uniref:NAD(P)/FAD-dependent oxidoreductase n=1 Tax=Pelotomaculum propionicicum TaxID=258475 RepID=UPI003B7EC9A1